MKTDELLKAYAEGWRDFHGAYLRWAYLGGANLGGADLSEAIGLLDETEWLAGLEWTGDGLIAYKQFGLHYEPPMGWKQEPGAVLTEVCNPSRTSGCASGVNVARRDWAGFKNDRPLWRVLIRNRWLPGVVVPYHTDGKFRCSRCELVDIVSE